MNKRTLSVAILSSGLFLASVVFLIGVLYLIHRADDKLITYRTEIAKQQAYAQELSSLKRLVLETEPERLEMVSYVLHDDQVIDFLALLKTIGDEQGVTLNTRSLEVLAGTGQFETLSLVVTAEGSYEGVLHILKLFEHLPYQSSIVSTVVQRKEEVGGLWSGDFALHITKLKKL